MLNESIEKVLVKFEKLLVLAFIAAGAFRIFIFAAAFPLFNNIDEETHFDLVHKYARGYWPTNALEPLDPEVVETIVLYGSPEYVIQRSSFSNGIVPPPEWKNPRQQKRVRQWMYWSARLNHETTSPPAYYFLAAKWLNSGRSFNKDGGFLAYWVRFLNVFIFGGLIFLAWKFARILFPDRKFLHISLPLAVSIFPQDIYYSINSDVLSPLLFGGSLLSLLVAMRTQRSRVLYFFAGMLAAMTILVKLSNLFLIPLLILIGISSHFVCDKKYRVSSVHAALATLGLTLPLLMWVARNHVYFDGDLLAVGWKQKLLGWTIKPIEDRFSHPVFSWEGAWTYFKSITTTFWRGELVWFLERMALPSLDFAYVGLTLLFIGAAVFFWLRSIRHKTQAFESWITGLFILCLACAAVYFIWLSTRYDFGTNHYPSRNHPYFSSGRLLQGMLLPFLVLWLDGFEKVCSRIKTVVHPFLILLVLLVYIGSKEFTLRQPVIRSEYNWFHFKR